MSCYSKTQDNFIICADFLKSVVKGYLKLFKLHSVGFLRIFFVFGFCSKGHMYFNLFSDINEVCIKTQINPRFCKLLKTRKKQRRYFFLRKVVHSFHWRDKYVSETNKRYKIISKNVSLNIYRNFNFDIFRHIFNLHTFQSKFCIIH